MAQLPAAGRVESVSPEANPAANPRRNKPRFKASDVGKELASLLMALQLRRVLGNKTALTLKVL